MSVYVDEPVEYAKEVSGYVGRARAKPRWCHMIADTLDELHEMADRLGLRREWFQPDRRGFGGDHYDLVPSKREQAVRLGAQSITLHQLGVILLQRHRAIARHRRRHPVIIRDPVPRENDA